MALIQGMENANKTRVRFGSCANGGFLEGAGRVPICHSRLDARLGGTCGQVAETLLAAGGALSVQVLNEFVAVARRKLDKSWEDVRRALDILRVFCPEPVPVTVEIHERAVRIAERYGYSIFDSLIIAAALHAGANTLYTEDMRDGQAIDGLTIRNPFSR